MGQQDKTWSSGRTRGSPLRKRAPWNHGRINRPRIFQLFLLLSIRANQRFAPTENGPLEPRQDHSAQDFSIISPFINSGRTSGSPLLFSILFGGLRQDPAAACFFAERDARFLLSNFKPAFSLHFRFNEPSLSGNPAQKWD
jgi:hypothetical protein